MVRPGVPEHPHKADGGALASVPAVPVVPADDLYRTPYLLVTIGQRYSIGWQDTRKAGPSFIVARLGILAIKVIERFPMTEKGWARAWRALVRLDRDAAQAAAARLAVLAARQLARAELAGLDAESVYLMSDVTFVGGYSAHADLAAGQNCDLRFLEDRLAAYPRGTAQVLMELPYGDIETVDIGGPGLVKRWSAGQQAGLTMAFGLAGAVAGLGQTRIQTILRILAADCELFFLDTQRQADALRIELSVPLRSIREARSARQAGPEPAARESVTDQLARLASMLETGLLTREEFDLLKTKLIAES
jgi:hypothetical protein